MRRYLQARTRFFDRVVVDGIARGARQVALVGAGYDGRALRYAAPGVRFFEVDHPDTQADKRARLDTLGIDAGAITFVAFDLADLGLDEALRGAGISPDAPTTIVCEGVLVYLPPTAIERTLDALRALAAPGTRLALSVTLPGRRGAPEHARFRERVAVEGEPAGNELEADDLAAMLALRRWRVLDLPERAARVGLMMGAPVWAPAPDGAPPTAGVVGRYLETAMHRAGADTLAAHLAAAHDLPGAALDECDVGVYDTRAADGRRVIVRMFPAARPQDAVRHDADLLTALRERGFPAEAPVAVGRHDGQPLLITEFAPGRAGAPSADRRRRLGELLGELHTLDLGGEPQLPAGGAWHHLVPRGGPPRAELDAMDELLRAARARVADDELAAYQRLAELLAAGDDCAGLPEALVHPDFVGANAIGAPPVIVDWAGCGRGPRLWSLAFLLWATRSGIGPVLEGYRAHVELTPDERARLAGAILARPVVLAAWTFATGRGSLADAVAGAERAAEAAPRISRRVLAGR